MKTKTQKVKMNSICKMSVNESRLLSLVNILFSPCNSFEIDSNGVFIYKNDVLFTYLTRFDLEFLLTFENISPLVGELICQISFVNGIQLKLDKIVL